MPLGFWIGVGLVIIGASLVVLNRWARKRRWKALVNEMGDDASSFWIRPTGGAGDGSDVVGDVIETASDVADSVIDDE